MIMRYSPTTAALSTVPLTPPAFAQNLPARALAIPCGHAVAWMPDGWTGTQPTNARAAPGGVTNIATFTELAPGTLPKTIQLKLAPQPAPDQTTKVWSGAMIVAGSNVQIAAYR